MPALGRWRRRALYGLGGVLLLMVAALALLQTTPVATWLGRRLAGLAPLTAESQLAIGRVGGSWISGLALHDVALERNGRRLAAIGTIRVEYDPLDLLQSDRRLAGLTVEGVRIHARREADGWDIAGAFRTSADTAAAAGSFTIGRLALRDVAVVAELTPDSIVRVEDLELTAEEVALADAATVASYAVRARVLPPVTPPAWLSLNARGAATADLLRLDTLQLSSERSNVAGRAVLPRGLAEERVVDQLAVELAARPLALADLASVIPVVRPEGELELEIRADAEGRRVRSELTGRLGEARLRAEGSALLGEDVPVEYRASAGVQRLDPAALAVAAPAGRISGDVAVTLSGPSLDRADGRVELRLDDSRVGETALRGLLRADVAGGRAELALRGGVGRGTIRASGWARPFDSIPSYRLAGSATHLPRTDSVAALLAGAEGDPHLEIGVRLAGSGIAVEQATSSGRVSLTAVRADGGRSPLGGASLELAESRLEIIPELLLAGGRIRAALLARLDEPVSYRLRQGVIEGVDLGRLMGDTVPVPLSGRFTLSGQGTSPDEATVRARLSLDEVRYGDGRLEGTVADLSLDRGRARLTARGALQGGRITLDLEARPFDSTPAFTLRRAAVEQVDLGGLLDRPDLAGPFTAWLSGTGRWGEAAREARGRLRIEPSTLGSIALARGEAAVALTAGRLRFDATLVTGAGTITAAGNGRPLDPVPSFTLERGRADSLDLGTLLNHPGLTTRINARLSAAASGTDPDSMRARLDLDLLPSRVNQVAIRSGRARLTLDRGALDGEVRMVSSDGELAATLDGVTNGAERRVRAEGSLRLDRLARWTGDTARDGNLAGRFSLEGTADSAGLLSVGGTVAAVGRLDSVRLDTLRIALSPEPGMLAVDTLVLRSNVAALDGGGRLPLRGEGGADTLRLAGSFRDLTPLAALAGGDSVSLDSARMGVAVSGPPALRRVAAEGAVHRLLTAGNQVERILLGATATLDSAGLAGAEGEVELQGGALGTVVVREARAAGRYDSVVSLVASARLRDDISLDAELRGAAAGDTVRATLERLDLAEGGRRWALERPAGITLEPSRVEIGAFALRAGESRITADGVLDRAGMSDLALALRRVELAPLKQLGFVPVGGRLEGDVRLSGPAEDPTLAAEMQATLREEERDAGRILGKVQWTTAGLALEAEAVPRQGGRLRVAGSLPVGLTLAPDDTARAVGVVRRERDTLGLTVRADDFGLAFFQPLLPEATAEELRGTLAVDGWVRGTMEEPQAEGSFAVRQFGVSLPVLGVRYQEGELLGRLVEDRLELERLRLVTGNDGELLVQGAVRLTPLTDPGLDLTAELREFQISNSAELRTMASGQLRLGGTAAVPAMTGSLTLGRTDAYVGGGGAAGAVEPVELTAEELQQLAREFGPSVLARAEDGPGLVSRFRIDLEVRMPGRVWVRQRGGVRADIEVAGRVNVLQEPGEEMRFFGEVRPVPRRGVIEMYGREFRLVEGEIRLAGPTDSTELDVTARYRVASQANPGDEGIIIDVNATGRPDSIALAFSSDPSMSDDDIISYIVIGRPASENPLAREETGEGPGAAELGAEVALGTLTESVAGAAGEALGLDVFQIRQDGLRGLTLTAGRYIGSRLFFSLQQPIQLRSDARQQSTTTTSGPGFELEYTLRRWLRANLQGGNLAPRFFLRGRHAF